MPAIHVVLIKPEIAPNTGNVIRLCANTGAFLHLVEPLGFTLEDKQMKRAGLDYHELTTMKVHPDWPTCRASLTDAGIVRQFALSARTARRFDTVDLAVDDTRGDLALVFGSEGAGLDAEVLAEFDPDARLGIPMRAGNRSLNLSNAVAIVVYESWRQSGYDGSVSMTSTIERR
jgi:tRNA (cytidine/uridine-2'-O-)-methyltransferase